MTANSGGAAATATATVELRKAPRPAAPDMLQLLSFIFASADLVMEITTEGEVTFATGAAQRLLGRSADSLVGEGWRTIVAREEIELIEAALQDLRPGERRGPFRIGLASGAGSQPATVSLFQVPQRDDRISVALSVCHPSFAQVPVDASGLASRGDFETAAETLVKDAARAGLSLHVDLLEFSGLTGALDALPPSQAEATLRKLAAILRAASYGGMPAAALGADRFALVRSGKANPEAMGERVREVAGPKVKMTAGELALSSNSTGESLRAIHYALGRCIAEGPAVAAKSFEAALRQTVVESARFKETLSAGRFELVYQPVVDLQTRALHHYEALTRFEGGGGPASTIKLAEELGLVVEFDITVVRSVVATLSDAPEDVRIAANISGFSLLQTGFVDELLRATAAAPQLRSRLLLEVTESHKLVDLETANSLIQRLRKAGHEVCLDDFGAGAASLDYLRRLEIDVVKFDGRFVGAVAENSRDATMLRALAALCRELGVASIGEMIETEEVAAAAANLGVGFGQGWLFGKPVLKPTGADRASAPIVVRRKGVSETWQ